MDDQLQHKRKNFGFWGCCNYVTIKMFGRQYLINLLMDFVVLMVSLCVCILADLFLVLARSHTHDVRPLQPDCG